MGKIIKIENRTFDEAQARESTATLDPAFACGFLRLDDRYISPLHDTRKSIVRKARLLLAALMKFEQKGHEFEVAAVYYKRTVSHTCFLFEAGHHRGELELLARRFESWLDIDHLGQGTQEDWSHVLSHLESSRRLSRMAVASLDSWWKLLLGIALTSVLFVYVVLGFRAFEQERLYYKAQKRQLFVLSRFIFEPQFEFRGLRASAPEKLSWKISGDDFRFAEETEEYSILDPTSSLRLSNDLGKVEALLSNFYVALREKNLDQPSERNLREEFCISNYTHRNWYFDSYDKTKTGESKKGADFYAVVAYFEALKVVYNESRSGGEIDEALRERVSQRLRNWLIDTLDDTYDMSEKQRGKLRRCIVEKTGQQ